MSVKIIPDPDVFLTESEYARLLDEYNRAFSFYAGTPPTFASWVAQRRGGISSASPETSYAAIRNMLTGEHR